MQQASARTEDEQVPISSSDILNAWFALVDVALADVKTELGLTWSIFNPSPHNGGCSFDSTNPSVVSVKKNSNHHQQSFFEFQPESKQRKQKKSLSPLTFVNYFNSSQDFIQPSLYEREHPNPKLFFLNL
ncbi:hypothetical protein FDP41_004256 [Naegleria fowleri]|uniref:Uncharacterized protein n=1 Tax=Naegleria fowleri TaxID=5763 RepID=A0A6A5BRP4_NAEFO|nr:uncharacterized protein FDP41_004256 [Naegleria fowleri]KAF0976961.1 hypothetical protein FDP41_004256 [Naegleria fowleri]